jgi:hypothetical protein
VDALEHERSFFGELDGPLTPLNYSSRALEASCIVKTGDGILYGFTVTNTKASAQWVMVFDARTVPANAAVPIIAKSVPASDAVGFDWLPGRTFFAGIVLVNSTTQTSLTIGAADCIFDAQYL